MPSQPNLAKLLIEARKERLSLRAIHRLLYRNTVTVQYPQTRRVR